MPPPAPPSRSEVNSPEFRRTIFRRFRIGVMLCLVLVPGLMWLLVNLVGKRDWRRVQKEMKQEGVALHFSELDLPSRAEVPDAENFCAIPWLVARDNNSASAEMSEVADEFGKFRSTRFDLIDESVRLDLGSISLGQPANMFHWALGLGTSLKEKGQIANGAELPFSAAEGWQVVQSKLDALAPRWQDLEKALDRPKAHWLPTFGDLNNVGRSPFERRLSVRISLCQNLTTALGLRALTSLERGDPATALRSVETQWRIIDATAREPGIDNLLEAQVLARNSLRTVMHCLWSSAIVNDSESLERLQIALQSVDFAELYELTSKRQLVIIVEGIQRARDRHDPASASLVTDNVEWQAAIEDLLPNGWYDGIAAEAAEIYAREVLLPLREKGAFERKPHEVTDLYDRHQNLRNEERERAFQQPVFTHVRNHATLLSMSLESETLRRQAIIVCALYRYSQVNDGKFPTELDSLVPDFIDSVPLDPLSSLGPDGNNQAMGYLPAEKNAPGPPFRVWSFGDDMQDGGGKSNLDDWPWPVEPLVIEEEEIATGD